jgi:hypothetical protein
LETPNRYEVTAGLKEGEKVMIGSQSQVEAGQKVEPKLWTNSSMKWTVPKGQ